MHRHANHVHFWALMAMWTCGGAYPHARVHVLVDRRQRLPQLRGRRAFTLRWHCLNGRLLVPLRVVVTLDA